MAQWDLEAIATALGGALRNRKPHVFGIELRHAHLGTRLKLDLAPEHRAVRLWCDFNDQGKLTLLGRVDLFDIEGIGVDADEGRVHFVSQNPQPTELEVRADATFLVTVGSSRSRQAAVIEPTVVSNGDDLVHLVGRLARPHYSDRTGKSFFTAGLAEYQDGAVTPIWHNLKAFGGVAREAGQLERGTRVRLSGKPHQDRYQKNGQEVIKPVILLVHIEAAD